jgi:uncharacterized protein YkwD
MIVDELGQVHGAATLAVRVRGDRLRRFVPTLVLDEPEPGTWGRTARRGRESEIHLQSNPKGVDTALVTQLRPLNHLRLVILATACAVLLALTVPIASASADGNTSSDYVARINALRASVGVQPLLVDAQLTGLAQGWAQHMASTGVLSHSVLTAGVTESWGKLGENVGVGPDNPTVWNAFIHSAEHYANLVDPAFNRVGVGVAVDGNGTEWTCHKFMQLNGAAAPPPAPRPPVVTAPRVVIPVVHSAPTPHVVKPSSGSSSGAGTTLPAPTTTTTAPPAPQPGPPPPANSQRVAAVLAALRQLPT